MPTPADSPTSCRPHLFSAISWHSDTPYKGMPSPYPRIGSASPSPYDLSGTTTIGFGTPEPPFGTTLYYTSIYAIDAIETSQCQIKVVKQIILVKPAAQLTLHDGPNQEARVPTA